MKHWPIIFAALAAPAAVLSDTGAAAAARPTCLLQSDLVMLQHEARGFLEFLKSGADPAEARQLEHWLDDHPEVALSMQLRRTGMEGFEPITMQLISQQKGLLEIYRQHGLAKAGASAERLEAAALLEEFASRIIPLPCDFTPLENLKDSTAAGMGRIKGLSQETAIASSFLVVVLGAGGAFLAERIARRQRRRRRRHPCSLPCTLQCGPYRLPAKLVDISRLGAKVRIWDRSGTPLTAMRSEIKAMVPVLGEVAAQVPWQTSDYVGLKFTRPLSQEDLQALLRWSPRTAVQPAAAAKPA